MTFRREHWKCYQCKKKISKEKIKWQTNILYKLMYFELRNRLTQVYELRGHQSFKIKVEWEEMHFKLYFLFLLLYLVIFHRFLKLYCIRYLWISLWSTSIFYSFGNLKLCCKCIHESTMAIGHTSIWLYCSTQQFKH